MLCSVLTASRSKALSEGLTYDSGDLPVEAGMLVRVPLRGVSVEGVVLETNVASPAGVTMRKIAAIESEKPVLDAAQLATLRWMAAHYCCTPRQAAAVFLPPLPWSSLLPKAVKEVRLTDDRVVRGKKQQLVIDALRGRDWCAGHEIAEQTGASAAVLKALAEAGIVEERRRRPDADTPSTWPLQTALPTLSSVQKSALQTIELSDKPTLLFGITGSGKTALYMHRIAAMAAQGKQSIVLVPEILLTEELLSRLTVMFGDDRIATLHSRLTLAQRRERWKAIADGHIALVIGSRSALFAPCRNLGLIIIDEEHEWTYKNEQTPRYHARETAEELCRQTGAQLILGSATPSLESWHRAKTGAYALARIPERFGNASLPQVQVIDLGTVRFGQHYPFSPPLIEAIHERLRRSEQSVLFLNRRGMATAMLCLDCRKRLTVQGTEIPLIVHRTKQGTPILVDHATGGTFPVPAACPSCGSTRLFMVGAGTQRLEASVQALFPAARVLRADSDTLTSPKSIRALLDAMKEGRADILLGTQAVVKGLDLPQVTLAAVLLADVGLSLPHFRAGERVFQLLTQLTGRSGRAEKPGDVIIQTFRPAAPEVTHAAAHTVEAYLQQELSVRQSFSYPPLCAMARVLFRTPDAKSCAERFSKQLLERHPALIVQSAATLFGAGAVWQTFIRGTEDLSAILAACDLYGGIVDIDPIDCL